MPECHDWFAEVAEAFVRYLVANAGIEVFGQSEWGADLAIRDQETNQWARCEVRSSDCNDEPKKKSAIKAELLANVTLNAVAGQDTRSTEFQAEFFKLDKYGKKIQLEPGGPAIKHIYSSAHPADLREWLWKNVFDPTSALDKIAGNPSPAEMGDSMSSVLG